MISLNDHLPHTAVAYTSELLRNSRAKLKISRQRLSKYGDYRPGNSQTPHRITVNGDLNSYSFLITLVHELAHAYAFERFGRKIRPHGKEWKHTFTQLMAPLLRDDIFPQDILFLLQKHMTNPKASTSADLHLLRALRKYDHEQERKFLEDLPMGSEFTLLNGRSFIKGIKKRKNYLCTASESSRKYLINPMAEVIVPGEQTGMP